MDRDHQKAFHIDFWFAKPIQDFDLKRVASFGESLVTLLEWRRAHWSLVETEDRLLFLRLDPRLWRLDVSTRFNTLQHVARCFEMFQRFSWISAVSNLVPSGRSMFSWCVGRKILKTFENIVGSWEGRRDVLLIFSCKKGRGLPPDGSHDFSKAGNWSIIHLPSVRAEVNRPRCRHLSSTTGQSGRCRSRCSLPSASQPDIARRESEMLKSLAKVHALDFLQCYIFYHFLMILEHLIKTDIWGYPMMAVTAVLGESEAWWFCVKATCLTSDLADLDRFGYLSMTKLDAEDFQLLPLASKVRW